MYVEPLSDLCQTMFSPRWEMQFVALNRNKFRLLVNTLNNYDIECSTCWIESRVSERAKKKKKLTNNWKSMLLNEGTNWKRKLLMKKNRNNAANRMLNFKWFHFCCFRSPTEISTHLSKGHIFGVPICYSAINKHKSQGTSVSWRSSNYRRAWGMQIVSEVCFFPGEWLPASFMFWLAMSSMLGLLITAILPAPPSLCVSLSVCNMTYAQLIVQLCWPWNDVPSTRANY